MLVCVAIAILLFFVLSAAGVIGTHKVSDLNTLAELLDGTAQPGDQIEVEPGTYYLDRPRLLVTSSGTPEAPIIVRGVEENGSKPVICASRTHVQNGIFFFPPETHDVILENFELRSAQGDGRGFEQVFSRNAAGVFLQGSNITVRNCHIHGCENGQMATEDADFILVENCNIGNNGRLEHRRGDGTPLNPHRTHNFYFSARRQIVRHCYIHNSLDGVDFKSRGHNTIFAFNWVEEDMYSSMGIASHNQQNTLCLGNVAVKRTYQVQDAPAAQRSLLRIGNGTGVACGKVVALNNTFVTCFPHDYQLFSIDSATTDVVFINNAFAGPGESFMIHSGSGTITGTNNWIATVAGDLPSSLENKIRGDDPGFVDRDGFDFRPREDSPLLDAGASQEEYMKALRLVTQHSRGDGGAGPSPVYLEAVADVEKPYPAHQPACRAPGFLPRRVERRMDIGAYQSTGVSR